MDILVSSYFDRFLWYIAFELASTAPDSARRTSAGATIESWVKSVKTNSRVEIPVEVLLAEHVTG